MTHYELAAGDEIRFKTRVRELNLTPCLSQKQNSFKSVKFLLKCVLELHYITQTHELIFFI